MYIIGSNVSDDQIPQISDEVKKAIETESGTVEKLEPLGKKKLAYPIKKTKIGDYILVNFTAPSEKINEVEHKIRTNLNIVRHLVINMDKALVRMEKDRVLQAKLKIMRPKEDIPVKPAPAGKTQTGKSERKIQIDLDAEIEKALESEDLK